MDWKEVAGKITTLAPAVGGAIGGPVGALAGTAISLIAKAFGLSTDEATPEKISELLAGPPDEWKFKILTAENEFKFKMAELELQSTKAFLADVQGARDREAKYVQALGHADYSMEVLGWLITAGFFTILAIRMFIEIPSSQLENVGILMGFLGAGFMAVVNYKFGSSAGSAAKSKAMEAIAKVK